MLIAYKAVLSGSKYTRSIVIRFVSSDRDLLWNCLFWKELCRLVGLRFNLTTSYHPEIHGFVVRGLVVWNKATITRCFCVELFSVLPGATPFAAALWSRPPWTSVGNAQGISRTANWLLYHRRKSPQLNHRPRLQSAGAAALQSASKVLLMFSLGHPKNWLFLLLDVICARLGLLHHFQSVGVVAVC